MHPSQLFRQANAFQIEAFKRSRPGIGTKSASLHWTVEQVANGVLQRLGIKKIHQPSGFTVRKDLTHRRRVAGDNRTRH